MVTVSVLFTVLVELVTEVTPVVLVVLGVEIALSMVLSPVRLTSVLIVPSDRTVVVGVEVDAVVTVVVDPMFNIFFLA